MGVGAAAPANDAWAAATPLEGVSAIAAGNTAGASREAGEPAVPGNTAGQTVWWSWSAPGDGLLTLNAEETGHSTAVAIFTGDTLEALQLRGANASFWGDCWGSEARMRPRLQTTVEAGRRYFIAADWNRYVPVGSGLPVIDFPICLECPPVEPVPVGGPVSFALEFQPAPANDRLAEVAELAGNYGELSADTSSAGREADEPAGLYRTVWWKWVAPHSGWLSVGAEVPAAKPTPSTETLQARLPVSAYNHLLGWPAGMVIPIGAPTGDSASGSSSGSFDMAIESVGLTVTTVCNGMFEWSPLPVFTPALSVFRTDSTGLVACLSRVPLTETNRVRVEAGATYHFALGSQTDAGGTAAFKFRLTAPENDDFSQRIPISGVEAKATGHLVGATRETGEPGHASNAAGHSAWWTWTAPDDGLADWTATSTDFAPLLAIYRGTELAGLNRIAPGSVGSSVNFRVRAGETVQLAVDAVGAAGSTDEGDYTLSLKLEPLAPELDSAPTRLTDGSAQFRVNHLRGRGFLVFGSDNLSNWQFLWAGVVNSDAAVFRDFTAIGNATRYYVVRLALPGEERWFVPPPVPPVSDPESVLAAPPGRRPPTGKPPSPYQLP